ncbi:MAG: Mu-like prophage major head subunit gpT family protein [Gammaproteobacteria bacterium]|nr:Mu-like prophage major head subunit gpT family protein [Gammaproteobacteria bacterium]
MVVNKESLQAAFISIKTTFNQAFDAAPSQWQQTAMLITSTSSENSYQWLSRFPKMRKWVGDKVFKALRAFKYTVENDDFEATVAVDRNDIEDDNLGILGPQVQDAGFSAKQLPDDIVDELKNKAFTAKCYDGKAFYSDQHKVAKATVSNKGTAALSNATLATAKASFGAGRLAITSIKDDEGRSLKLIPGVLEVPPALETEANMLMTNDKLADGTPNPFKGMATVLLNPGLTSPTQWMLHVTNRPLKPFIYQERKKPVFVSQTGMDSDDVFSRKEFKFGAEARAAGGYGLWQMSYGSTGAG